MIFNSLIGSRFAFGSDWAWGLPLIVLTVLIHVSGLGLASQRALRLSRVLMERHHPRAAFLRLVASMTMLATCLHGIEAAIWAIAYLLLGALPNAKSAVVYSLNAITSYGHTNLSLEGRWELLGALEALNGWLLFGLTTAFLFDVIQNARASENRSDAYIETR
jgi:hypothetical protein